MVSRSRVRVSRLLGAALHPKVGWFLRRRERRDSRQGKVSLVAAAQRRASQQSPPPYLDIRPDQLNATLTRDPRRPEVPGLAAEPIAVEVVSG